MKRTMFTMLALLGVSIPAAVLAQGSGSSAKRERETRAIVEARAQQAEKEARLVGEHVRAAVEAQSRWAEGQKRFAEAQALAEVEAQARQAEEQARAEEQEGRAQYESALAQDRLKLELEESERDEEGAEPFLAQLHRKLEQAAQETHEKVRAVLQKLHGENRTQKRVLELRHLEQGDAPQGREPRNLEQRVEELERRLSVPHGGYREDMSLGQRVEALERRLIERNPGNEPGKNPGSSNPGDPMRRPRETEVLRGRLAPGQSLRRWTLQPEPPSGVGPAPAPEGPRDSWRSWRETRTPGTPERAPEGQPGSGPQPLQPYPPGAVEESRPGAPFAPRRFLLSNLFTPTPRGDRPAPEAGAVPTPVPGSQGAPREEMRREIEERMQRMRAEMEKLRAEMMKMREEMARERGGDGR